MSAAHQATTRAASPRPTSQELQLPSPFLHRCARFAALCLLILLAAPTFGDDGDRRWSVGVDLLSMSSSGDVARVAAGASDAAFEVGDGDGYGLRIAYEPSSRWRFGLFLRETDLDSDLRLTAPAGSVAAPGSLTFEMYWLTAEYRVVRRPRWALFAGPTVVMSKGSDQVFTTQAGRTKLTFDDDFGFGLVAGADWDLGDDGRWQLRLEVSYLSTILETDSDFADIDLDPISLAVGFTIRF